MNIKCDIIETIKIIMIDSLDEFQMKKLDNTLINVLDKYDIAEKVADIVVYDDTNERALKFFTGIMWN